MRRSAILLIPFLTLGLASACAEDKADEDEDEESSEEDEDVTVDKEDPDDEEGEADEEEEEEEEVPDESLSEDDEFAAMGCDQLADAGAELILGTSSSEANTAVVVADEEGVWALQMPESGDGWFTIEIPDWMTVMRVFTEEGVEYEIIDSDPFTDILVNGACPDEGISDQRVAFHEWGAYTVRVSEGAPETIWFAIAKEQ